jgi:hypothetical protein
LTPGSRIQEPGWVKNQDLDPGSGFGMNISDRNCEGLETIFGLKVFKFFDADPDPGSGIFLTRDPESGINIPDPQHCYLGGSRRTVCDIL